MTTLPANPHSIGDSGHVNDHNYIVTALTSLKRMAYQTRTTNYTPGASVAAAGNIFSSNLVWTHDGSSTYWLEFYCGYAYTAANAGATVNLNLVDNTGADMGNLAITPQGDGTRRGLATFHVKVPLTNITGAGTKTVNLKAVYTVNADAALNANSLGAGNWGPMWAAVYGPGIS